jgi:hypothetical protein
MKDIIQKYAFKEGFNLEFEILDIGDILQTKKNFYKYIIVTNDGGLLFKTN